MSKMKIQKGRKYTKHHIVVFFISYCYLLFVSIEVAENGLCKKVGFPDLSSQCTTSLKCNMC